MRISAEIINRFAPAKSANGLLYSPIEADLEVRESVVYDLEAEGSKDALQDFVKAVLADHHAQEVSFSGTPAIEGAAYHVDVAMKRNVLDLEKEYLLAYYRSLENPGFDLKDLVIKRRVYVFGNAAVLPAERLVRDLVNPVIQEATLQG